MSVTFFCIYIYIYRSLDHIRVAVLTAHQRLHSQASPVWGYGEKRCESVTKLRVRSSQFAVSRVRIHGFVRKIPFFLMCVRARTRSVCTCTYVATYFPSTNITLRTVLFFVMFTIKFHLYLHLKTFKNLSFLWCLLPV